MSETAPFSSNLHFCPLCGSVLPLPTLDSDVIPCSRCPFKRNIREHDEVVEKFVLHFNAPKKKISDTSQDMDATGVNEFNGPTVERICPKCNHDTMIYTTRQTRSADEGQTVFYTCVNCKFQDIEYS
ncbi:DNA-directed RNA polymerase I subunit RPA12 [Biomphalaria pfeifferi]|uniref:DNA-directed RNA polymerase subunit n=1 Tax=Biomphalaria pfeifferi TaxID=112525 RepID=A0AAD8AUP3_BIOPF|nr:DNA-directed RNA polymerase I subunit RPA12 [Biomphalaria pfeifferi]